jgi:hypothetical protein
MGDALKTIVAAPIATILVLVGLGLIVLSFLDRIKDYKIGKGQQNPARIIGALILIAGLLVYFYDQSKDQISSAFGKARPGKSDSDAPRKEFYELKTSSLNSNQDTGQLGITIWRLRPPTNSDTGPRLLVQESRSNTDQQITSPGTASLVPERVEADTLFQFGDRVFLTIESSRAGHLYVINREQYADGTMSAPYLIYPVKRPGEANNQVTAGRLISIPEQNDNPNYFSMKPLRANQVGEQLLVVVTKEPVRELPITNAPLQLSNDQLAKFEPAADAQTERYEMKNGAGRAWTPEEKEAGENQAKLLTQEGPLPQTIYRTGVKADSPLAVKLTLRYSVPKPSD